MVPKVRMFPVGDSTPAIRCGNAEEARHPETLETGGIPRAAGPAKHRFPWPGDVHPFAWVHG
jgi:hypothetical protein